VITGFFDADVSGGLYVNGHEITGNTCCETPYSNGYGGNPGGGVSFTVSVADLLPGANTISVVLHGDGNDDGTLLYITQATVDLAAAVKRDGVAWYGCAPAIM
jgi:hypothetical protein